MLVALARSLHSENPPPPPRSEGGETVKQAAMRKSSHAKWVEKRIDALHSAAGIPREPHVTIGGKAARGTKALVAGRVKREEDRRRRQKARESNQDSMEVDDDCTGGGNLMPSANHRGTGGNGAASGADARRAFLLRMDAGELQMNVSMSWYVSVA